MKILIHHNYGMGDMVMFTPVLEVLKKIYKDLEVDFLITQNQKASTKVIENFSNTNKIYYINLTHKIEILKWSLKWRNKYNILLYTSGSLNLSTEIFSLIINSKLNLLELWEGRKSILKYIYKFIKKKYVITSHNINIHRVIGNLELIKKGLNLEYKMPRTRYYLRKENIDYSEEWSKKLKKI